MNKSPFEERRFHQRRNQGDVKLSYRGQNIPLMPTTSSSSPFKGGILSFDKNILILEWCTITKFWNGSKHCDIYNLNYVG
jgi:hypothetical protein